MKYIPPVLILFIPLLAICQEKIEREYRIKQEEVPQPAIDFIIKTYSDSLKVKWYKEESDKGKSYEAKLKWNDNKHSVEFGLDGLVQDIEIEAGVESIPEEILKKVESELEANFTKYKIRKIQVQYSGSASQLTNAIKTIDYREVLQKFEIVFEAKEENELSLWEGLFDIKGNILSKRRIIEKPTDNLDF